MKVETETCKHTKIYKLINQQSASNLKLPTHKMFLELHPISTDIIAINKHHRSNIIYYNQLVWTAVHDSNLASKKKILWKKEVRLLWLLLRSSWIVVVANMRLFGLLFTVTFGRFWSASFSFLVLLNSNKNKIEIE